MSRKLHKFQTVAEYQAYSASTDYITPCVAVVEENNVIYYDYGNNQPHPNYTDYKVSSKSLVSDGGDTYGRNEKLCLNYIPSGVTSLESAFSGWTSLEEVTCKIPDGVTSMYSTFRNCTSLVTASEIPNSVKNMSSTFLGCSSLVNAPNIPDSVTNMSNTFFDCSSLVNAPVIHSGVTDMEYTFYGCSSLVNAPVIPDSVTNMSYTFNGCSSLVNAPEIPSGVTNMPYTFNGCSSLVNAPEIPSGVTYMSYIFANCTSLKEVTFLHTTPPTYRNTLYGCSKLESIYVPYEAVDAFKTATQWSQFASKIKPLSEKSSE